LVLLDAVIPGGDGFEALRNLLEINPALPVILTSSDNRPGELTKAKALGASAYITRPVRRVELFTLISAAFRKSEEPKGREAGGAVAPAEKSQAGERAMEILVAEDSEDNRFLLVAYLNNRPYELTFAENGREALAAFAAGGFDLVLMDVQMPVMDGWAATAALRALERERSLRPVPIVALTANARVEDAEQSQTAGCNTHLSKPISKEKLIAAIESFRDVAGPQKVVPENAPAKETTWPIQIPEGFEELSRGYIARKQRDVLRMMELLPSKGLNELRVFGHDMKGTGACYGFPELTKLGAAIEAAAKAGDLAQLADQLSKVSHYVEFAAKTLQSPAGVLKEC
jgi:CheY-like chemotaxis protein